MQNISGDPARLRTYFAGEKKNLTIVTLTGLLYNVGLLAGPWFEGQLAQYFVDIIRHSRTAAEMARLAAAYVLTIFFVQLMRFFKRLYVRKFANQVNLSMKQTLYNSLVHKRKSELESTGTMLTKAISDVDACAEGMRKFTTELFDTGVALIAYAIMLFLYDWRMTLIVLLFPPIAYVLAEKMKVIVTKATAAAKATAGHVNEMTMDRIRNAVTYRAAGEEENRDRFYEKNLGEFERQQIRANIWENTMQPLYAVIAMAGTFFIIWLGARNVTGSGWRTWNIAAFSTYLSCFLKLATKSSRAAKLFNSVQKAQVSWKRIQPYMQLVPEGNEPAIPKPNRLTVRNVSFPADAPVLNQVSFSARPGDIIGITGGVASGKSMLGKLFLREEAYRGSIQFGGSELRDLPSDVSVVAYLGHDPELFSDTIRENVQLGSSADVEKYLAEAQFNKDFAAFPEGDQTRIGEGGVRLSGGQQDRIAIARTLAWKRPVIILDDPFSAVDHDTEDQLFEALKKDCSDCIVLLISHRLRLFPQMSQVLWVENGTVTASSHEMLLRNHAAYRHLYELQAAKGKEGDS